MDAGDEARADVGQGGVDGPGAEGVGEGAESAGRAGKEQAKREAGVAELPELFAAKGGDEEIGGGPAAGNVIVEKPLHGEGSARAFELDVDESSAIDEIEHLAEEGHFFALAGVEGADLLQGAAAERAAAIGRAVELRVVDDDPIPPGGR